MLDHDLYLPRTRLAWTDGRLTRFTKTDEKMADFAADEIRSLEIYRPWDPTIIGIGIGCAAIAAAAFQFMPSNFWRGAITTVFGIVAILMLLAVKRNRIRVSLTDGADVEVEFADAPEEVEAFLSSVRNRLETESDSSSATSVSLVA